MSLFDLVILFSLLITGTITIWLAYSITKDSLPATDEYDVPAYKRKLNKEQQNKLIADLEGYKPTVQ